MMSLTFGQFTQVSGSGPLGPLVYKHGVVTFVLKCSTAVVALMFSILYFSLLALFTKVGKSVDFQE